MIATDPPPPPPLRTHTRNAQRSFIVVNPPFHAHPLGACTDDDGGSDAGTAGEWGDDGGSEVGTVVSEAGEWTDDGGSENLSNSRPASSENLSNSRPASSEALSHLRAATPGGSAVEHAAGEWTDDGGSDTLSNSRNASSENLSNSRATSSENLSNSRPASSEALSNLRAAPPVEDAAGEWTDDGGSEAGTVVSEAGGGAAEQDAESPAR